VRCTAWRKLHGTYAPTMSNVVTSMTTSRPISALPATSGPARSASAPQIQPLAGLQPSTTQAPAAGVAHGGEVGDKFGEAGLVADRVAADHRVAHPGAVGDGRRAVRRLSESTSSPALRTATSGITPPLAVDKSPNPGQCQPDSVRAVVEPHQHRACRRDEQIAEQVENQHMRAKAGQHRHQRQPGCGGRDGLPKRCRALISATAVRIVSDHASRPAACQSLSIIGHRAMQNDQPAEQI